MPFSDHNPRLNFLKESASTLSTISPSTAAHLMMVHNHIFRDECKPLNQRQQETSCGACGSIRTPETTKTTRIQKKKSLKRASAAKGIDAHGATVYKCLRCHRRTVKPSRMEATRPPVPSRVNAATKSSLDSPQAASTGDSSSKQVTEAAEVAQPGKAADNASSKKRAKARKQGGLQALLASKQKSQASSSSLDLFDFLQQ
ncbi:hypothetical protein P170DRAFT_359399 [Aspergillus steynii IBT 23096]|uniref:Cullin binding protein CanA n=1 Tax=Aspergillus steynii IBT 23096 TaxID=1392250 RepID=A0A2I2G3W1_9EURO|nr:uncharacterized protein P170DRAFT_359399 [Aspergillus steynii IBT 23096]PLB47543.1 hypothetical protein P170DRAFT_359399 [Aspergillus steynii IBT 23096]